MLFWSVIAVLSVILLSGLLAQKVFIGFMQENEECASTLLARYFQTNPPDYKSFKRDFKSKVLGLPEEAILTQIVAVVSRPINSWAPSASAYMDLVEFHIKNLRAYRLQDCIIRILLICGILGTLICFALQANKLVDDELVQTAANGFGISACGIAFAVILIFVRYFCVEASVNSFSRKCEELIVTGLIPAFHDPSNSVLQRAVDNFSQHVGDMQESFSSLKTVLENISSTQTANNDSMEEHVRGLKDITKDFNQLSAAIRSVSHEEGPFVSLLKRINTSEKEFTEAIMELLPKHNAELEEMKKAVAYAAGAQKKTADAIATTVSGAYGKQSEVLSGAIGEMKDELNGVVVRMGQAWTSVSKTVKDDHTLMQNAVKSALADMGKVLKEHAETQQTSMTAAMDSLSKTLKESAEKQQTHQSAAMDGMARTLKEYAETQQTRQTAAMVGMTNTLTEHAKNQQVRQEEVFSKLSATADGCKGIVTEASHALTNSSREFAERISSALAGEMKELKTVVGGIVDAMQNVDEAQRKHLSALIVEKVSQLETKLKDVATAEAVGHIRENLQGVATAEGVSGLQASVNQLATREGVEALRSMVNALATEESVQTLRAGMAELATNDSVGTLRDGLQNFATKQELEQSVGSKLDEVSRIMGDQGEALDKLQATSEKLTKLADNAGKIVSVGKMMDEIKTDLKAIADNAQKAANKRGFNW